MDYRRAVAEARQLIKRSEADQWRLAELTAQVLDGGTSVSKWAADLGVGHDHVRTLQRLWARYAVRRGERSRSFGEFYVMARKNEEHAAALEFVADETGRKVTTVDRQHGEQVQVVRKLLRTPEVARDALRDQRTRTEVARASMQVASEQERQQRQEQARRAPEVTRGARVYDLLGRLVSARRQVTGALNELRQIDLDDEDRESLREVAEELENAVGWLLSYVRSGERSWDAALDRLLSEGR